MADAKINFGYSTVATAPTTPTAGTSLVLAAGTGATIVPTLPANAVVWPANAQPTWANAEIVRVTARATDTLTITRTQESTSARTIVVGDQIMFGPTKKWWDDIEADVASSLTQVAINAATIDARNRADAGYYVASGGAISISGTSGKLDFAAATMFMQSLAFGGSELICAAQVPITSSSTITTLASGLATGESIWYAIEMDTAKLINFTPGTAAVVPTMPAFNTGRVPIGMLHVKQGDTTVSLSTSGGTDAKFYNMEQVRAAHPSRLFMADTAQTLLTAAGNWATNGTTETSLLGALGSIPLDSMSLLDTYHLTASGIYVNNAAISTFRLRVLIGGTAVFFSYTTPVINTSANARRWELDMHWTVHAVGNVANVLIRGHMLVSSPSTSTVGAQITAMGGGGGGDIGIQAGAASATIDNTAAKSIDLLATLNTASAGATCSLREFQITKQPVAA